MYCFSTQLKALCHPKQYQAFSNRWLKHREKGAFTQPLFTSHLITQTLTTTDIILQEKHRHFNKLFTCNDGAACQADLLTDTSAKLRSQFKLKNNSPIYDEFTNSGQMRFWPRHENGFNINNAPQYMQVSG